MCHPFGMISKCIFLQTGRSFGAKKILSADATNRPPLRAGISFPTVETVGYDLGFTVNTSHCFNNGNLKGLFDCTKHVLWSSSPRLKPWNKNNYTIINVAHGFNHGQTDMSPLTGFVEYVFGFLPICRPSGTDLKCEEIFSSLFTFYFLRSISHKKKPASLFSETGFRFFT